MGDEGPDGFDCSGLVKATYQAVRPGAALQVEFAVSQVPIHAHRLGISEKKISWVTFFTFT